MTFWIESKNTNDIFDLQWRAAYRFLPRGVIPDPAARILLERLGFPITNNLQLDKEKQNRILASCWLDQQCLLFFEQYPDTVVIEIGAGFSSRFHRLSAVSEWPRFKWIQMDQAGIVEKIHQVLPAIDNFSLVVFNQYGQLLKQLLSTNSVLILVEQKTLKLNSVQIQELCSMIANRIAAKNCVIEEFAQDNIRTSWIKKLIYRLGFGRKVYLARIFK